MKIDSKASYGGVPSLAIRDFLRKNRDSAFSTDLVQEGLGVSEKKSQAVLNALISDGYLTTGEYGLEMTIGGNAFANASAGPLIRREVAEEVLAGLLDRAKHVNSSRGEFLYVVENVILFGSMLSDKPRVSDVDVVVELKRKSTDDFLQATKERVRAAKAKGRRFSGFMSELFWPYHEVQTFLKDRSAALSLIVTEEEDKWVRTVPHNLVYSLAGDRQ